MTKRMATQTLRDHHGTWCAHCLRYFVNEAEEAHHVYPKWSTSTSRAASVLVWTLPVHREGCHRQGVQRRSDAAGLSLQDIMARSDSEVSEAAQNAFYGGNLNLSFLLEFELAYRARDREDFEVYCTHLLNAIASAAGSALAREAERALETLRPEVTIGRASDPTQTRWALSMGNFERNLYRISAAVLRYDQAAARLESMSTLARKLYHPAYLRRFVTVRPSVSQAKEAVALARENRDSWGLRTALLVEGWNNLAVGLDVRARERFERVFWEKEQGSLSWWHAAEAHFGLGLCYLSGGSGDARAGLGHCLRSQYIRAILALRGDVVVGVHFTNLQMDQGLAPADVIKIVGETDPATFTRDYMIALRNDYLDSDLHQALFKELEAFQS